MASPNFQKTDKVRIFIRPASNQKGKFNVDVKVTRNGKVLKEGRVAKAVTPKIAARVAAKGKNDLAGNVDDVKIVKR